MSVEIDWPATNAAMAAYRVERDKLLAEFQRTRDMRTLALVEALGTANFYRYKRVPDRITPKAIKPSWLRRAWRWAVS